MKPIDIILIAIVIMVIFAIANAPERPPPGPLDESDSLSGYGGPD